MGYKEKFESNQEGQEIVDMIDIEEEQAADDAKVEVDEVETIMNREIKRRNYLYVIAIVIIILIIIFA